MSQLVSRVCRAEFLLPLKIFMGTYSSKKIGAELRLAARGNLGYNKPCLGTKTVFLSAQLGTIVHTFKDVHRE